MWIPKKKVIKDKHTDCNEPLITRYALEQHQQPRWGFATQVHLNLKYRESDAVGAQTEVKSAAGGRQS